MQKNASITRLHQKIQTADKIDNNALKMYQTSTSFLPTWKFAWTFYGIFEKYLFIYTVFL